MSQEDIQVCDACGVTAEMGYMIGEGDEVAEVQISAPDQASAATEFDRYLSLAKSINENVVHDFDALTLSEPVQVTVKLQFECSAEKLIFELRSRSIQ